MTGKRTTIYLARHGQTALNESGVLRGLLDPPLNETGQRQATLLGKALGPLRPALVVASPLLRARETAQPVADHAGLTVTAERSLLDRDYGRWAGTPKDAVTAQWGSVDAAPGVEPRSTIRIRALEGLTDLVKDFPGATLVAVSHDAVNQEVLAALDPGLGDPDGIQQDNGCFNILQWADGSMAVLSVNVLPGAQCRGAAG
ncbi:MAG: histidine phosphatase family protein [Trebonia sp.]